MFEGDASQLYAEWHRLTGAETLAIQGSDWEQLRSHQAAKTHLQSAIIEAERHEEPRPPGDASARRAMLEELIRLEAGNLQLMARCQKAAEDHRLVLDQSRSNLRRLQQQFVVRAEVGWQRYS